MVGVKFSRIVECQSEELADSLVAKLVESPRTTAYRSMNRDELREEYRLFFRELTNWLLYRGQEDIAEGSSELGRRRASQGVSLEECVNAMLVCRDHLVDGLRQETSHKGLEWFGELEFVIAVNHFFDDAIFYCMKGHRGYERPMHQVA